MTNTIRLGDAASLRHSCTLFSGLSEEHLAELGARQAIRCYQLDDGEGLILCGRTDADAIFLLRGSLRYRTESPTSDAERELSEPCKPLALPVGVRVEATARGETALCRMDRDEIDYLTGWNVLVDSLPPEKRDLREHLAALRDPAVLMRLPFQNVETAFERMHLVKITTRQEVVRQGAPGDRFYIIESGTAEVWQQGLYDDAPQKVAELQVGDHFGDEALISGGTRNATVRMTSDGVLLALDKADFQELIGSEFVEEVSPQVAKALVESDHELLDVRYEEEYEENRLAGSRLIPLPELRRRTADLDRGTKYLAYCLSGKRSAVAAMILRQRGFEVVCLRGGLRDWPYEVEGAL